MTRAVAHAIHRGTNALFSVVEDCRVSADAPGDTTARGNQGSDHHRSSPQIRAFHYPHICSLVDGMGCLGGVYVIRTFTSVHALDRRRFWCSHPVFSAEW